MICRVLVIVSLTILASCAAVKPAPKPAIFHGCECEGEGPVPPPPLTYPVFFSANNSNLTSRAKTTIEAAVTKRRSVHGTIVDVSGYTDGTGTVEQNLALSARRAQAVGSQLVADGVPLSAISIHSYGETFQPFPASPDVAKPQNRRVEIMLEYPATAP